MAREEERFKAADDYIHKRIYQEGCGRTGDTFPAFIEGAEWADENPDGKMLLHVLGKGVKQGKRETLDKVCEWLLNNVGYYSTNALGAEYMCEDLRKAMERDL